MSVKTKARSTYSASSTHYEIEINLGSKANMQYKPYILAQKTLFKGEHFSHHQLKNIYENIPTVGMKLRTYCKLLSQEQKERGLHVKFYFHVWMIAIKR